MPDWVQVLIDLIIDCQPHEYDRMVKLIEDDLIAQKWSGYVINDIGYEKLVRYFLDRLKELEKPTVSTICVNAPNLNVGAFVDVLLGEAKKIDLTMEWIYDPVDQSVLIHAESGEIHVSVSQIKVSSTGLTFQELEDLSNRLLTLALAHIKSPPRPTIADLLKP